MVYFLIGMQKKFNLDNNIYYNGSYYSFLLHFILEKEHKLLSNSLSKIKKKKNVKNNEVKFKTFINVDLIFNICRKYILNKRWLLV
jgi:hypothetical protein